MRDQDVQNRKGLKPNIVVGKTNQRLGIYTKDAQPFIIDYIYGCSYIPAVKIVSAFSYLNLVWLTSTKPVSRDIDYPQSY
jgi:hypothetical protein